MARLVLMVLGGFCMAMGLLFTAQAMGIVRWPASSFMIDNSAWTMRGGLLAAVGLVLFAVGRRISR